MRTTGSKVKLIFLEGAQFAACLFPGVSKNIPPVEYRNSIQTGSILLSVCCFPFGCFYIDFPSVACFRCRQRPLYRRERGKVFGLNTLCPQRKIQPETARPPDLFTFNEVCTNFHGRRGSGRPRNRDSNWKMPRFHVSLPSAYPYPRRFYHRSLWHIPAWSGCSCAPSSC